MIADVHVLPFGRPANTALRAAIDLAKASRPLAAVTVIVPSNFAGLAARRALGSGIVGSGGIANVSFLTPFRFAELLAAGALPDRKPLTNPVLGAAVRATLAETDTVFRQVADHHATEAAVARVYAELSNVDEPLLHDVAAHGPTADAAVSVVRSVRSRLQHHHGEADLALAATQRVNDQLQPFGHLVWFLPSEMTPPIERFLRTAFERSSTTVIVGATGNQEADRATHVACEAVGVRPSQLRGHATAVAPPIADLLVSVTDADEEIREVTRRIVGLAADGIPLDRIGVFYPAPDPYVRMIEQHFRGAGLTANGPSPLRLADSTVGRTLLGALELPTRRWRRDRVLSLVSGAPVRFEDRAVRPSVWERISRSAGVVQDLSDWRRKLGSHQGSLDAQLVRERAASADPRRLDRIQREIDDVTSLARFITELEVRLAAFDRASSWAEKASEVTILLEGLLGREHAHGHWPEAEQDAFERVADAIDRLSALDEFDPQPETSVFIRALNAELDVARGRHGRFGDGVTYGPLTAAVGQDLDAVFVVGAAEGLMPSGRRDDPLLPDGARQRAVGQLRTRSSRLAEQHRSFLAALSAAPARGRTLTFPRGDLRSHRQAVPSRWLLESASALAGTSVFATDFEHLGDPIVDVVSSHAARTTNPPIPMDVMERDLAAVSRYLRDGGDLIQHPVGELIDRGLQMIASRRSEAFTAFDGNLGSLDLTSAGSSTLSPSRLETWAQCGFRYYLGYVLGLSERDDPERAIDISPLDRGSAIHDSLEKFIAGAIEHNRPEPHEAWTDADREQLRAIALETLTEYEARGRTGREVIWRQTKRDLLGMLDEFLAVDTNRRNANGTRPTSVELAFGLDGADPVTLTMPDGRQLGFRGRIDRVDQATDGAVHVYDYKTGKGAKYKGLPDDPFQGGTTLQLGLYAEAARRVAAGPDVPIHSHYWMIDPTDTETTHGYQWTSEHLSRFVEVLDAIVEGIDSGVYPAVPGEWNNWARTHENCRYCDFNTLCPVSRGDEAAEKASAAELQIRTRLIPVAPQDEEA